MMKQHLLFGTAYYDEYMPYDRIETDMQMMERAGMNVIRIAESTWSTLEPQDGVYDFTYIDRMLEASARHHIDVIVGTPTYAIPSWLAGKSEDMLALTEQGQELYGHRQNMDLTNPVYQRYADRITTVLMEHVQHVPHIIGYQIDNETHHYHTYGRRAQQLFVAYLRKLYPDIADFNREFGLDYWSNRVDSWNDFPDVRGTINGSLAAEYERFLRSLVTDFFRRQADIINRYRRDDQFLTHNFDFEWHGVSYGLQPDANQWDAAQYLTVAGCDIYHPSQDALTGAEITALGSLIRGLKCDNYLLLETQAQGNTQWLSYPGQLRLCAYSHLATGADSVMYWHWHSIHNSFESYWKGVLSHDFSENATYREICMIGSEFRQYGEQLVDLKQSNQIAILLDHESLSGLKQFPTGALGDSSYNTAFRLIADALYRCNLAYDVIYTQDMHLGDYDLVFVPSLYAAAESTLQSLSDYTAQGGHLVVTPRSGFADEHIKIYHDTQPHIIHRCLGIHYDQFTYPNALSLDSDQIEGLDGARVREWIELVSCDSATALASYNHPYWGDYAAVTENRFEKGSAFYIGCFLDNTAMDQLCLYIAKQSGLCQSANAFPIIEKSGINRQSQTVYYYLNFSGETQHPIYMHDAGTDLFSGRAVSSGDLISLKPWDVAIILK